MSQPTAKKACQPAKIEKIEKIEQVQEPSRGSEMAMHEHDYLDEYDSLLLYGSVSSTELRVAGDDEAVPCNSDPYQEW